MPIGIHTVPPLLAAWLGLVALAGYPPVSAALDAERFGVTIRTMLSEGHHPFLTHHDLNAQRDVLASVYEQRQYQPLWVPQGRPSRQATLALQALRAAAEDGLRADDYEANRIIYDLTDALTDAGADASRWAQIDLALSTEVLRWVTHLHYGRIEPRAAGFNTPVMAPTHLDRAAVLSRLADTEDLRSVVSEIEPPFQHYRLLKAALPRYRALAADSALTILPPLPARSVAPGEPFEGAPALRRLLHALGDLEEVPASAASDFRLDPALVAAVKQFQRRHGLRVDGTIGKATFAALTTPLAQRVRQIELTLERWRWLPGFSTPPIIVNIPQFRLFALRTTEDAEADMLQMDVIVGQTFARMRTPIFAADMTYVVFRPYWDVPYSIMSRELLPEARAKPGYFASQNLEIVRGAGDDARPVAVTPESLAALAAGELRLRQRPGPDNALGLVKFMLPNRYNVYLHSTPAIDLFNEPRRAFSHGCIRVSDPVALAEHVLRNTPGDWTPEKIRAAMNGTRTLRVNLSEAIPVMILYATAVATQSGEIYFFEDLYEHDTHLEALLEIKPVSG